MKTEVFNPGDFRLLRSWKSPERGANLLPTLLGTGAVTYRPPAPPTPAGGRIEAWGGGAAGMFARDGCYRNTPKLKVGEH
jgi:hypothetical protein